MKDVLTDVNWDDLLLKFSHYEGTIADFCKENNISPHRLYHQRKKAGLLKPVAFFPISFDEDTRKLSALTSTSLEHNSQQKPNDKPSVIEINIGKATIALQDKDTKNLSLILKVLLDIC